MTKFSKSWNPRLHYCRKCALRFLAAIREMKEDDGEEEKEAET